MKIFCHRMHLFIRVFVIIALSEACLVINPFAAEPGSAELKTDSPTELETQVFRDTVAGRQPFARMIVKGKLRQFSFITPNGFIVNQSADALKLTLMNQSSSGILTISITESDPENPADQPKFAKAIPESETDLFDQFFPIVDKRYPDGEVTDEFEVSAAGFRGPVFETVWKTKFGSEMTTRDAFIVTPEGTIEITQQAERADIRSLDSAFNSLLLTMRSSPIGEELEVVELSSQR